MSDEPQSPLGVSIPRSADRSWFLSYFVLPCVVALVTYFVSLHKLDNPSDGALNGLNGVIAGVFAAGAFVGTLVGARVIRGASRPR